jgi:hypothetical protein
MSRPEARSASNSSRLLSLWLPNVALHVRGAEGGTAARGLANEAAAVGEAAVGEAAVSDSSAGDSLDSDLPGGMADPEALAARPGSALLFPSPGRPLPLPKGVRHLIVPDGTWAQARRIERRCFATRELPRVALAGSWPSVYGLRRGGEGMCTFEAVAISLGLLDDPALGATLLARFAEWASRARRLKLGGAAWSADGAAPAPLPAHPSAALLRALPPDSADADLAGLERR